jgi:lipid-binding SYLF domain-containing protein
MALNKHTSRLVLTSCSLALASFTHFAAAQAIVTPDAPDRNVAPLRTPPDAEPYFPTPALTNAAQAQDAAEQVTESAAVVQQMERDGNLRAVLEQARGIFIVPDYARAAWGVGARGGEGILLVKTQTGWSDPLFYNMGGISGGLQAGAEAGSIAMILNNERAVNSFMQNNNWSLNADAGLTVVAWSAKGQASVGKGDVIVWSDTEGLFGDLAISVTDINFDESETAAFYGGNTSLAQILTGEVESPPQVVSVIKQALPSGAQRSTGSSMPGVDAGATSGVNSAGEAPAVGTGNGSYAN